MMGKPPFDESPDRARSNQRLRSESWREVDCGWLVGVGLGGGSGFVLGLLLVAVVWNAPSPMIRDLGASLCCALPVLTGLGVVLGGHVGIRIAMLRATGLTGHCPQCRYDLRGQMEPGCPECGWRRGEIVGDEEST